MLRFLNLSVQAECIGFRKWGSLAFTFLSALGPWPVQSCRQHVPLAARRAAAQAGKLSGRAVIAQVCVVAGLNDANAPRHSIARHLQSRSSCAGQLLTKSSLTASHRQVRGAAVLRELATHTAPRLHPTSCHNSSVIINCDQQQNADENGLSYGLLPAAV
jgi:hypothetical protein